MPTASEGIPTGSTTGSAQLSGPTPSRAKVYWWSGTKGLLGWTLLLVLCFSGPLYRFVQFAWGSELYSYILLIPFVSFYLTRLNKTNVSAVSKPSVGCAIASLAVAMILFLGLVIGMRHGWKPGSEDYFAVMMIALLALFLGGLFLFIGRTRLRALAFPVCFLVFIVPFPAFIRDFIESFLQHRSADVAQTLLSLAGMPVLRHDTVFRLPGFVLEVAPECSGVHSTVVLFITSLVAGYLFLSKPWHRVAFTLAVIPLALSRNGFRIFTVAELCVNVDPAMINSYIHRKGGPIFFGLSLIPFGLLLLLFRKLDNRSPKSALEPRAAS